MGWLVSYTYAIPAGAKIARSTVYQASIFPEKIDPTRAAEGLWSYRWRWIIRTANGAEYVDGGNYLSQEAAEADLRRVLDSLVPV